MDKKIPLALSDFEAGRFRKIAKFISNKWPIPECNPSLSEAQDILSKILGYNDLHDAMKSASASVSINHWSDDFDFEISHELYSIIYDGVSYEVFSHKMEGIENFIRRLPVHHLAFFRKKAPEVEATQEVIDLLVRSYSEGILSHNYSAKSDIHSLPGAVSNCISILGKESHPHKSYTIREALAAVTLQDGTRMADFVKSEVHGKALKDAISRCMSEGEVSFYNIPPAPGYSHLQYFKALDTPANFTKLEDASLEYLESCMDQPTDSLFIESFKSENLQFSAELFDMEHSILIDDDEALDEEDCELDLVDEPFSGEYMRQKSQLIEKAENALLHCTNVDTPDGSEEFGIFFKSPDSDLGYDFYRWYLLQKDNEGKQLGYVTGIAFSQSKTRIMYALDLKEAASESQEDEDDVVSTINEYRKRLPEDYKFLPIDDIRIGSITNGTPLVIIQNMKKAFDETDYPGRGLSVVINAVGKLQRFFDSNISLSIMIEPSQFINQHVAPSEIKMDKIRYAEELSRYFAEALKQHRAYGINMLLLPTFGAR